MRRSGYARETTCATGRPAGSQNEKHCTSTVNSLVTYQEVSEHEGLVPSARSRLFDLADAARVESAVDVRDTAVCASLRIGGTKGWSSVLCLDSRQREL